MALYYWVGGTNSWNATATGKWSNSSGGAPFYAVNPTAADDVIFDSFSTAGTVVTLDAAATVGTITFATFPGTFTFAANISSGNTTLGTSTTYTASGGNPTTYTFTTRNVSSTFTANGKILPTNLTISLSGASTLTFAGNADFGGNLSTSATGHNIKAATGTTIDLRIGGNISFSATTVNATDYITIKGYGTSKTYSSNSVCFNVRCNFVSGSSYTSLGNAGLSGSSFLTVESGGQFNAVSTHSFSNGGTTTLSGFNSSNNSDFYGYTSGTLVLSTDIVIKSFIQIQALSITITSTGASKLLLEGSLSSISSATTIIERLEFSGTTASNITAVSPINNLQIREFIINKTGAGSVNFNSNGIFSLFVPSGQSYSFTHTNGIVTQSSNCIVRFACNNQLSTMNYSATNLTFRYLELQGGSLNLNSQLLATTLKVTPTAAASFTSITSSSTFGFNVESFIAINFSGVARPITLKAAVVYDVTASLIMTSTAATAIIVLNSSIPGTRAIFNLANSATQTVEYVNATDIDSSGTGGVLPYSKQTIYSFAGVIAPTTINWGSGSQPPPLEIVRTVAHTFVT